MSPIQIRQPFGRSSDQARMCEMTWAGVIPPGATCLPLGSAFLSTCNSLN